MRRSIRSCATWGGNGCRNLQRIARKKSVRLDASVFSCVVGGLNRPKSVPGHRRWHHWVEASSGVTLLKATCKVSAGVARISRIHGIRVAEVIALFLTRFFWAVTLDPDICQDYCCGTTFQFDRPPFGFRKYFSQLRHCALERAGAPANGLPFWPMRVDGPLPSTWRWENETGTQLVSITFSYG